MGTTTKYALPWPAGADLISQGDEAIRSLAETVDGLVATDSQGTFASRPAAGKIGRYYRSTDLGGVLFRDDGTVWHPVGRLLRDTLANRPSAVSVGAGVGFVVSDLGNRLDVSDGAAWVESVAGASPILNRAAALITVGATTTETTIFTYAIAGNTLSTDKAVRLRLFGEYLNNSGANKFYTVKVKLGATTIYGDAVAAFATSANTRAWWLDLTVANQGATNVQRMAGVHGLGSASLGSIAGKSALSVAPQIPGAAIYGTAAIDTTASATLVVTIENSSADAAQIFSRQYGELELL